MSDRNSGESRPVENGSQGIRASRRELLRTGGLAATLLGTTATASADPTGQVGTASDPLEGLYTAELNGPVTDEGSGPQAVTGLAGEGLSVASGTLSATGARLDVTDGSTTVQNVSSLTVDGLRVADDGNGVRIDR